MCDVNKQQLSYVRQRFSTTPALFRNIKHKMHPMIRIITIRATRLQVMYNKSLVFVSLLVVEIVVVGVVVVRASVVGTSVVGVSFVGISVVLISVAVDSDLAFVLAAAFGPIFIVL
ncbi:uncharacterized protein LOC124341429 [Daphnia pulicaria]|uniref:uncharacterized protein LOC124341429 n=1 Tax=Daphnia pulicaria TaxID=35523 RepID=UPI001EECF005|nr:uncharacterized protein LOC124341429 [Daphnia pulicaria]